MIPIVFKALTIIQKISLAIQHIRSTSGLLLKLNFPYQYLAPHRYLPIIPSFIMPAITVHQGIDTTKPMLVESKVDQIVPEVASFGLPQTIEDKTKGDYLDPNKISIPVPGAVVASMPLSSEETLRKQEVAKEETYHRQRLQDLMKTPLSNSYEKSPSKVINFTLTVSNDNTNGIDHHDLVVNDIKPAKLSGAAKLQNLLKHTDDLVVCPGVYDGFSARIAMSVGFQCLYMVCCQVVSSIQAHSVISNTY